MPVTFIRLHLAASETQIPASGYFMGMLTVNDYKALGSLEKEATEVQGLDNVLINM